MEYNLGKAEYWDSDCTIDEDKEDDEEIVISDSVDESESFPSTCNIFVGWSTV